MRSTWWGYAEADATIVGVVVALVFVFAIAYLWKTRSRSKRREGRHKRSAYSAHSKAESAHIRSPGQRGT